MTLAEQRSVDGAAIHATTSEADPTSEKAWPAGRRGLLNHLGCLASDARHPTGQASHWQDGEIGRLRRIEDLGSLHWELDA